LKHDGFRSLTYIENGQCRLVSRHRNTYKSFETLRIGLARLRVTNAILDGEIVCLDSEGQSQFKKPLYRRGRAVFYAFDLLWLNGADLQQVPLIERSTWSEIIYAQHDEGQGSCCPRKFASGTLREWCARGRAAFTQSMVQLRYGTQDGKDHLPAAVLVSICSA
jgi:ATP dependent DNA ligase domain